MQAALSAFVPTRGRGDTWESVLGLVFAQRICSRKCPDFTVLWKRLLTSSEGPVSDCFHWQVSEAQMGALSSPSFAEDSRCVMQGPGEKEVSFKVLLSYSDFSFKILLV